MFRRLFGGKKKEEQAPQEQPPQVVQSPVERVPEPEPPVVVRAPARVEVAPVELAPEPEPFVAPVAIAPSITLPPAPVQVVPALPMVELPPVAEPPPSIAAAAPDVALAPLPTASHPFNTDAVGDNGAPTPAISPLTITPPNGGPPVTYRSVAEYDAAMQANQPAPVKKRSGLFRWFGGEQRAVEEIREEQRKTEEALEKTRSGVLGRINQMFQTDDPITEALWEELEEVMLMGDVGFDTADRMIHRARRKIDQERYTTARQARGVIKAELLRLLETEPARFSERTTSPYVILVVGVNGAGKTTLIAKTAARYKNELGKNVLLAAGDTFRAAAVEQLATWADRVGVPIIAHAQGTDPGAVAFDAVQAALTQKSEVLIIDTAGRLQSKYNLMQELEKIRNIIRKRIPDGPHEVLLVVDATTGQNGISQAKAFAEAVNVTHLAITKLDGTAKGGIAFAMVQEIERPIKYIGTGEKVSDLAIFDAQTFVDAIFSDHKEYLDDQMS